MILLTRALPSPLDTLYEWQEGDQITHLDGRPIEDIIDLYYYTPETDVTTLDVQRQDGQTLQLEIEPEDIDSVTTCFAPLEFRTCACKCVFCFVDQNPCGMRDQIYIKDEDYRFSFLYGNYITMTSLGKRGIERIIEQKMSPLFVSVHATDIDVRTRMLGIKKRIDVVELLKELAAAGIEIHTQVVLCPGWNDGAILEQTIGDLLELAPKDDESGGVHSLAIVPVGLTGHRKNLALLNPVTKTEATAVIETAQKWQTEARSKLGISFCYLSDEFYLLAERAFPPAEHYDNFSQIDNAVGLTSNLRESWREQLEYAAEDNLMPQRPLTILTSTLAAKAWQRDLLPVLTSAQTPAIEVIAVKNTFYGNTVTVAGLLTGQDIRAAVLELPASPQRHIFLSPRVFNSDEVTLDGMTLEMISEDQPHSVTVAEEEGFIDFWAEFG